MEFRILGQLEAWEEGRPLALGAGKQRTTLGVLLLYANEVVSVARLVDELWGERPPARAAKLVQGYVSGLRKSLGPDRIVTQPPGYLLRVEQGKLDLAEFKRLVERAQVREALALWRGPALADVRLEGFAAAEVERLNGMRLAVLLDRVDGDLRQGRHTELVGELEALVAQHPLHERPRGQLMLALYRAGRQADALELYRATRSLLAEELGLEPSLELQELERRMLTHDPELDLPRAAVVAEPPRTPIATLEPEGRVRRQVSFLFADLLGSTTLAERLDPESLHGVLARYSEACADVLERHGGTVEKYIGDAVVAVFGHPRVHEDDALRAVRAAVELRQAVADLSREFQVEWGVGLDVKVGVNSGQVFVGRGTRREAFASGDALNVAARLEQSAGAGEILLGDQTYRLVQAAVRAEPLDPMAVKGRTEKVGVWRLLELHGAEVLPLRPPTPFVGRERELAELEHALARVTAEGACRLFIVVGPPGIGKSRLARELIERAGDDLTVVLGRCLSYGEGITYLPLAEIVRQLGEDPGRRIAALLEGDQRADVIAELVLGAAGLAETSGRTEDVAWAFRRLLEALARERPLLVVFEDVHWAEPTLLELVESVASFSSGAPILLLFLARPDLLEERPAWAAPHANRSLLALDPLPDADARELVDQLSSDQLGQRAREQIAKTAEGNPLFLEQLVAVQREGGQTNLPPSVQAVLAARIDRLEPAERTLLERASVEGRSFHRGALAEVLPEEDRADLGTRLIALLRKQLIRPERPELAGEDAFRFAHVLIREAAYEGLPKQVRADLHERLAAWLEERPGARDEIVGYHLEQAHRCLAELGRLDGRTESLAARGADRLASAGRLAFAGGDMSAAAKLLRRVAGLYPDGRAERLQVLPTLGKALRETGELGLADTVLAEAAALAGAAGDRRVESLARIERASLRDYIDPASNPDEPSRVAEESIGVFEDLGDDGGLAQAFSLLAEVHWTRGQFAAMEAMLERALVHAERSGDTRGRAFLLAALARAALLGPAPVEAALRRCEEIIAQAGADRVLAANVLPPTGGLHALRGDFERARAHYENARATFEEFGLRSMLSALPLYSGPIELLAGNPQAAERELRRGLEMLEEMGDRSRLASATAFLAQALYAQGRYDEADTVALAARDAATPRDSYTQAVWRGTHARVLAGAGEPENAERVAREGVAYAGETDSLDLAGDALLVLAEVLAAGGRTAEAAAHAAEALRRYRAKGNQVSSRRAEELATLDRGRLQA